MPGITGVVSSIGSRPTKTGKTFYVVVIGGQEGTVWDAPEGFEEGDTVTGEYTVNGQYTNWDKDKFKLVSKAPAGIPSQPPVFPSGSQFRTPECLARDDALANAIALAGNTLSTEEILDLAEQLYQYTWNGPAPAVDPVSGLPTQIDILPDFKSDDLPF